MEEQFKDSKILIVDDEPMITLSLKSLLQLEGDYDAIVFNSPLEALDYAKENRIDLVISDFLMPQMNGIEFLAEVKKYHPDISLILLTGYADKENAINAINKVGLYRYMEKPWQNDELLICIKNGLERSHLYENLELKVKELDTANQKLENYNKNLEELVKEKTNYLQEALNNLECANNKLNATFNSCADGIIIISKSGMLMQTNPAFERMSGVCLYKEPNINLTDIFEKLDINLSTDQTLLTDLQIQNKTTQKTTPVEISIAPVFINNDKINEFYICVIRDITTQQEANRLRDDFIATLTHDLKTPLHAAIQTLDFFLDGTVGTLNDKQHLLLETMKNSNKDLLSLVNNLLQAYKYESGQLYLSKDEFELKDFIDNCINEIDALIKKKEINLIIDIKENEKIYADKQELKRVFINLLGNAISYTSQDKSISIYTEIDYNFINILIKDEGKGIPSEDIPKLFNRFSQGTSKKRSTGTGLGLFLSRQIVEAHGGNISLESEYGNGSVFKFSIPRKVVKV